MRLFYIFPIILVFIAGCSTRPLTDLPVRLSSSQIINKLRCEMKLSVQDSFKKRGFESVLPAYKRRIKKLDKGDVIYKRLNAELNKTLKNRERLKRRRDDAKLEHETVIAKIKQSNDDSDISDQERDILFDRFKRAVKSLNKETVNVLEARIKYREKEKALFQFTEGFEKYKNKILVDFATLIDFYNHRIVHEFNTLITETNDLNGTGTFSFPIHLGIFTLGASAGEQKKREADRDIAMIINFKQLLEYDCKPFGPQDHQSIPFYYPIKGNIGLDAVIKDYLRLAKKGKFTTESETYVDKLTFTTMLNATVNPSFTIMPTLRETLKAEATAGIKRSDEHQIRIGLLREPVAKPAEEEKITKVFIVKSLE